MKDIREKNVQVRELVEIEMYGEKGYSGCIIR